MTAAALSHLPGSEIVRAGLDDLGAGRDSEAAAAVLMAATRLRGAGIAVPDTGAGDPSHAAHRLYELLAAQHGAAAHSRYNAVVRRIVSFARAAEHAAQR